MSLREADYLLALSCVRGIGGARARLLLDVFGSGEDIFKAKFHQLSRVRGIPEKVARAIADADPGRITETVRNNCRRLGIAMIARSDERYPYRLAECLDSPLVLFYKGSADLNPECSLSIVGTRRMSHYGKFVTELLVSEMTQWSATIISGLAYGIDFSAHRQALKKGLPTIAILPGGIDRIYPADHTQLAARIAERGGLLSEMPPGTVPEKEYFPTRNRIIAGISDGTLIIESGESGGSMITAYTAHGYEREVLAVPGRISDPMSCGPNKLITNHVGIPVTTANDIAVHLGWGEPKMQQQRLFEELTEEEQRVVNICREGNSTSMDELMVMLSISHQKLSSLLLSLEFKGAVRLLPGNRVVSFNNTTSQNE